jgi:acyl-CoA thioesterase-2
VIPEVPGPQGLSSELDQRKAEIDRLRPEDRQWLLTERRRGPSVNPVLIVDPPKGPPVAHNTWIRTVGRLPDDAPLHEAAFAYAGDMTLLDITC